MIKLNDEQYNLLREIYMKFCTDGAPANIIAIYDIDDLKRWLYTTLHRGVFGKEDKQWMCTLGKWYYNETKRYTTTNIK